MTIEKPVKKPKEKYIDNEKFLEEIILHKQRLAAAREKGDPVPRINNYLGECLLKIAERMAYRPEFINYSFVDDMRLDAIENMIQYFDNFNPEIVGKRSGIVTPFGYFSQVAYYAFARRITKEEKYRYTKYKVLENVFISVDGDSLEEYSPQTNSKFADSISDFVKKFEERERKKKLKREEKKKASQNENKE